MHVREKANELTFGESYCGTFICSGADARISPGSSVWDQIDFNSVSKTSSSPITFPNDLISERRQDNAQTSDSSVNTKKDQRSNSDELVSSKEAATEASLEMKENKALKFCHSCMKIIEDSFVYQIDNFLWHENCKICVICGTNISQSCFFRKGMLYCKSDYKRIFNCCRKCGLPLNSGDQVIRGQYKNLEYSFHVNCCACVLCKRSISKEECYIYTDDTQQNDLLTIQCKSCWADASSTLMLNTNHIATSTSPAMSSDVTDITVKSPSCVISPKSILEEAISSDEDISDYNVLSVKEEKEERNRHASVGEGKDKKGVKRPRTILTPPQRAIFKQVFESTQKPNKKEREKLASNTGLTPRVVQVWFQNQRAKVKKIQKRQQNQEISNLNAHEVMAFHGFDPLSLKIPSMPSASHMMSSSHFDPFPAMQPSQFLLSEVPYRQAELGTCWDKSQQDRMRYNNQYSYSCVYHNFSSSSELRMTSPGISTAINCDHVSTDDVRMEDSLSESFQQRNIFDNNSDVIYEPSIHHDSLRHQTQEDSEASEQLSLINQDVTSSVTDLCLMQNSYLS